MVVEGVGRITPPTATVQLSVMHPMGGCPQVEEKPSGRHRPRRGLKRDQAADAMNLSAIHLRMLAAPPHAVSYGYGPSLRWPPTSETSRPRPSLRIERARCGSPPRPGCEQRRLCLRHLRPDVKRRSHEHNHGCAWPPFADARLRPGLRRALQDQKVWLRTLV